MVEITYQMVLSTLQTIALIVGIAYYLFIMRNSQRNQELARKAQEQALETRQAQLLMNIMNSYRSPEFRKQWHTLWNLEWSDFDDFKERYEGNVEVITAWTSVITYFESVGVITKNRLIDIQLIHSLLALGIKLVWERYKPLIMGDREQFKEYAVAWDDCEYLYHEILRYEQQHPELKT